VKIATLFWRLISSNTLREREIVFNFTFNNISFIS